MILFPHHTLLMMITLLSLFSSCRPSGPLTSTSGAGSCLLALSAVVPDPLLRMTDVLREFVPHNHDILNHRLDTDYTGLHNQHCSPSLLAASSRNLEAELSSSFSPSTNHLWLIHQPEPKTSCGTRHRFIVGTTCGIRKCPGLSDTSRPHRNGHQVFNLPYIL